MERRTRANSGSETAIPLANSSIWALWLSRDVAPPAVVLRARASKSRPWATAACAWKLSNTTSKRCASWSRMAGV